MRNRPELLLKYVCWALGALVLIQVVRGIRQANPLAHVTIPALPALAQSAVSGDHHKPSTTHPVAAKHARQPAQHHANHQFTKTVTNHPSTGKQPAVATSSNSASTHTNVARRTVSPPHSVAGGVPPHPHSGHPPIMVSRPIVLHGSHRTTPLPPQLQARMDRITDSEILGPVIHPLPMALLGIAGNEVFLRAFNGQTGMVKTGAKLGGIKLLQIGINRVLIEQAGQKKELTIFGGMGGHTLLAKPSDSSHETHNH